MKKVLALFAISLGFFLSACSGGSGDADTQTEQATESTDARTIQVYGIDRMKYVVEEESEGLMTGETVEVNGETYYLLEGINASAGEELTIELTTISSLPETAMAHNVVVLQQNTDAQGFANAAVQAKDNGYIPQDMTDAVIAKTEMIGGGSTSAVTFMVPSETGDYEYLCSFPAHFSAGMRGTLNVE